MLAFASLALAGCGGSVSKTGIELSNLDQKAKPGDNFYQYACGGWIKAHPLTGEYSTYGNFEVLIENNNKQLRDLIEAMAKGQHEAGTLEQKIGDLYNIAMDSVKQNKEGYAPIQADLEAIAAIQDRKEIIAQMAKLGSKGLPGYFGFYIDADIKNSSMNLLQIGQGGLSLGEKEYYLDNDSATVHVRESFKAYMEKMFTLCGSTPEEAKRKMEAVMGIETRIAVPSYSAVQQRDPEANYHKMTYEELKKDYSGIDWDVFFSTMGIQGLKEVSVGQPEPIHEVEKILAETPVEDQKAFMEWKLINSSAPYLSDELRACSFDFYGRVMSGKQQDRPRWKKAVATVEGVLGEGLGEKYVEKYFPAAAKERMVKLVKNLQDALAERIKVQDWMSDETKKVALDKLASFYVKVGYPDKWRDYSGLEIKDDSYWANIVRSNEFDLAYVIDKKLNKPVDRDEWYMTPQTVNAYYNPTTNEICFPAAILQPPFFNPAADDAVNYGAIGVVIGHEMTHGFDDQGRQFDKDGNMNNWWTDADAEAFKQKTDILVKQFDAIEVLPARGDQPAIFANGSLCLGENIADQGGLRVAYTALKNSLNGTEPEPIDGLTPAQRFYLSYATVWAQNIRDEEIARLTKLDVHSLGQWRVDATLRNLQDFFDAFNITDGKMYMPVEERVIIW